MQNHLEIKLKNKFWTRHVRDWTKSRDLVMSGPVQEDPYGSHKGPTQSDFCRKKFTNESGQTEISSILLWGHLIVTLFGLPIVPLWGLPIGPGLMGPIWVLLDRSGHDQITTFGQISHASGPKLGF